MQATVTWRVDMNRIAEAVGYSPGANYWDILCKIEEVVRQRDESAALLGLDASLDLDEELVRLRTAEAPHAFRGVFTCEHCNLSREAGTHHEETKRSCVLHADSDEHECARCAAQGYAPGMKRRESAPTGDRAPALGPSNPETCAHRWSGQDSFKRCVDCGSESLNPKHGVDVSTEASPPKTRAQMAAEPIPVGKANAYDLLSPEAQAKVDDTIIRSAVPNASKTDAVIAEALICASQVYPPSHPDWINLRGALRDAGLLDTQQALGASQATPSSRADGADDGERIDSIYLVAFPGDSRGSPAFANEVRRVLDDVRRETIEACAKVCEAKRLDYYDREIPLESTRRWNACVSDCAAAVRATPFTSVKPKGEP